MSNQKPEFHEDYANRDAVFAQHSQEFNYDALFERLDGLVESGDIAEQDITGLPIALKNVFDWLFEPVKPKSGNTAKRTRRVTEQIGRRAIALAWVMDPSRFGNDPSLTQVGTSLGIHKAVMSELTSQFSKQFGVRNKHQSHGWNYKPNENEQKGNPANN